MRDYVVRFLEALYESECDENGVKWKDEYSLRIDNIIDRLTFMEEILYENNNSDTYR